MQDILQFVITCLVVAFCYRITAQSTNVMQHCLGNKELFVRVINLEKKQAFSKAGHQSAHVIQLRLLCNCYVTKIPQDTTLSVFALICLVSWIFELWSWLHMTQATFMQIYGFLSFSSRLSCKNGTEDRCQDDQSTIGPSGWRWTSKFTSNITG